MKDNREREEEEEKKKEKEKKETKKSKNKRKKKKRKTKKKKSSRLDDTTPRTNANLEIFGLFGPTFGKFGGERVDEIAANDEEFRLRFHRVEARDDEIKPTKLFVPSCERRNGQV